MWITKHCHLGKSTQKTKTEKSVLSRKWGYYISKIEHLFVSIKMNLDFKCPMISQKYDLKSLGKVVFCNLWVKLTSPWPKRDFKNALILVWSYFHKCVRLKTFQYLFIFVQICQFTIFSMFLLLLLFQLNDNSPFTFWSSTTISFIFYV